MQKVAKGIVRHYKGLALFFLILTVLSGLLASQVGINYSLVDYMPEDAPSMKALDIMKEEFKAPLPNLRITVDQASIPQVIELKEKLKKLDSVKSVMWLDDVTNVYRPLELIDSALLDSYYKDGTALLQVAVEGENSMQIMQEIRRVAGQEGVHYEGNLVGQASSQAAVSSEISMITMFMVPIGTLILMLAVRSWIEPLLLLASIGVAIVINMGTNVFLGRISFITQAITAILQLAVSMDYAIFLLHAYAENQEKGMEDRDALIQAIVDSSSAVVSSALTTVLGFLALTFMRFRIGPDMGLVLAKGVAFSLISVIFFLPTLLVLFHKWILKTRHRNFMPDLSGLGRGVFRFRHLLLLILALVPVAFLAQSQNNFLYGMGGYSSGSVEEKDTNYIRDKFGQNTQIVLLIPRGNAGKEKSLVSDLKKLSGVRSVVSYTEQVGEAIPDSAVPKKAAENFLGEKYARIILNTSTASEGKVAFDLVDEVRALGKRHYGEHALLAGESVTLTEMKDLIRKDNQVVNVLSIGSVALVILLNFQSVLLPILLVLTIEAAIWINLSVPYFTNTQLSYIGYLVISSIQLGATVDYGILFTNHYLTQRKTKERKDAVVEACRLTYRSILPPAIILTLAGVLLSLLSSIHIVSEIGTVLGRGAFLSLLLVMFLLPVLVDLFDRIIEKTTRHTHFYRVTNSSVKRDAKKGE